MSDPTKMLDWLRTHVVVLDQSEPESFESITEAIVSVIECAFYEAELAGTGDALKEAVQELGQVFAARRGTGSQLGKGE
jgi:hypothetical protein